MARIFHLSDLHFGMEDSAALGWVAGLVRDEAPDAVIITGDFTMRARHREFAAAAGWIETLGVPVAIAPGNHDLPYFNPLERFADPYRRFRKLAAHAGAAPLIEGLAIIRLDTTARAQWRLNWSKGRVGGRGLAQCLASIDALPPGTRVLVACHHPLVEVGTQGRALTRGGDRALEALAARGITAVLSGHVHDAFDLIRSTPRGPVRMIGAGTLSERLRTTPPAFNELTFHGKDLTVRNRRYEASQPDPTRRYR